MAKFVCLLVILAIIEASYALQCYKCGGVNFTPCKESESEKGSTITCSPKQGMEAFCAKIIIGNQIERGCIDKPKDTKLECTDNNNVKTCLCQKDKCNSATTIGISFLAFTGIAARFLLL